MSESLKICEGVKFQDRWDFRRKDSECDSWSSDSKTSKDSDPEKQKLMSISVPAGDEVTVDAPSLLQNCEDNDAREDGSNVVKSKRIRRGSMKKGKAANDHVADKDTAIKVRRKRNDPAFSFSLYVDSLLEDLRVTRESLVLSMREEMEKLLPGRATSNTKKSRRRKNTELATIREENSMLQGKLKEPKRRKNSQGQETIPTKRQRRSKLVKKSGKNYTGQPARGEGNGESDIGEVQPQKKSDSTMKQLKDDVSLLSNRKDTVEILQHSSEQGFRTRRSSVGLLETSPKSQANLVFQNHERHIEENISTVSKEKDFEPHVQAKLLSSSSDSALPSSMYLTLPTVVSESSSKSYGRNNTLLSRNLTLTYGNQMAENASKSNLVTGAGTQGGYLSHLQQEQLSILSQDGFRNNSYFGQQRASLLGIGSEFPLPLRRGLDSYFSISNQFGLQKVPQQSIISSLQKMDGTLQVSSGNNAISPDDVANKLQGHFSYRSGDTSMPSQVQYQRRENIFPN